MLTHCILCELVDKELCVICVKINRKIVIAEVILYLYRSFVP
jgi:hypothetical protein